MMTMFSSPGQAPGVSNVALFRDHADPHKFYMIPNTPRIAVDQKTGTPLFDFTLFSRNLEIAYASTPAGQPVESQLGALNFTVDLSVQDADIKKISDYLVTILRAEMRTPSQYNILFKAATTKDQPQIGYVDKWTDGSVTVAILEGLGNTFKRQSSPAGHPTLTGTNAAALWATFGSEGAQLFYKALKPSEQAASNNDPNNIPLQANIQYDITTFARSPALRVSVTANADSVYQEIRKRMTVQEHANNMTATYPALSDLTRQLVDTRTIDIQWDDFGIPDSDPKAEEIKNQLQQTVMGLITNQIVGLLFKPFDVKGVKTEDAGQTFVVTMGGKPGSLLFLNDYKEGSNTTIGFTLNQSQNFKFQVFPQTSLLSSLTPDQLEKAVRVIDVGSPEVRVLSVTLLTNADFANDRIANITVSVSYKQFDTLVNDWIEAAESYVFKTGEETFTFRARLARDPDGKLIDKYSARAEINYIGTAQSPPPIDIKDTSERTLTFSYDRLGYVKVDIQVGDVDFTQIKDVYVDLIYPSASNEPDAKATVHLTDKVVTAKWTCSKHGAISNAYMYSVRYVFLDGREVSGMQNQRDDRGTLVIHDQLIGKLRRTFEVVMDPQTVTAVFLKVRYNDGTNAVEEARKVFNATGTWDYVRALTAGAPQELDYSYEVSYADGQFETFKGGTVGPDDDLPAIQARRFKFSVGIDGGGVDWDDWRTVLVHVEYQDDKHNFTQLSDIRLSKDAPFSGVDIQAFSVAARSYSYRAEFVPSKTGTKQLVQVPGPDKLSKTSGTLLLETLIP